MAIRHPSKQSLAKCQQCGAWAVTDFHSPPQFGCIQRNEVKDARGAMCREMKINLLEMALGRALLPDAFDERARIKPGALLDVMDARSDALRQVAALSGPVSSGFPKDTPND